jgi:hypothetical protein
VSELGLLTTTTRRLYLSSPLTNLKALQKKLVRSMMTVPGASARFKRSVQ